MASVGLSEAARLDRTLKALQDRVQQQEKALNELRASSSAMAIEPSEDLSMQMRQVRTIQRAYESMTVAEPFLPSPDSPIPALLALRNTYATIRDSKIKIQEAEKKLGETQKRLELERADLKAAEDIAEALRARGARLEKEVQKRNRAPAGSAARDYMRELESKSEHYNIEMTQLIAAFNNFVDVYLAPMLAHEENGGPVVGERLDEDDDYAERSEARQMHLDDFWSKGGNADQPTKRQQQDASAELRELTEDLLNNLVENGGGAGAYVKLQRESAAARFLVRSMVAQFHPRDATRLRLIDFGKDLEN